MMAHASGERAALFADEEFDAFVGSGEAVLVDQLLPDRHRVATVREALFDQFAIGLAGARCGGNGFESAAKVGGHLNGRF